MRVAFSHSDRLTPTITTFWFHTNQTYKHQAGQFSELIIPHKNPDKRGTRRWFTLSSAPSEDLASITTKFTNKNGSSFKRALSELKPGAEVNLTEPMGDFTLPNDPRTPIVLVAGGIGVTPARSMVKALVDSNERRDITLFYAANSQEEFVFTDIFSKYKPLTFVPVVKQPPQNYSGESGMLDIEIIKRHTDKLESAQIYISGPPQMVSGIKSLLKDSGVRRRQIVTDYFPGY